jgi:hypothetical protein
MSTGAEKLPTGQQVQELLARPESKVLEFKTDLHDQEQAAALIAAMANSGGGQIVLGTNENADAVGLEDPERTRTLLEKGAAEIAPAVSVTVREERVGGQPLLVAELEPNPDQGPFAPPSGAIQRRDQHGRNVALSGRELVHEVRSTGGGQGALEELLGNMNRRLEAMEQREHRTTEEARQAFKEARDARSWKAQLQGWLIGGVIGAILGVASAALLGS